MTAVVRVLPRLWDGHRLLRFLTGLAMLTLAFTAHLTAPPARPAPVAAVAPAETAQRATTQLETAPVATTQVKKAAEPVTRTTTVAVITAALVVIAGTALRVRSGRSPPARFLAPTS